MISQPNTTGAQKLDKKKYVSFQNGLTYSISTENFLIEPFEFHQIIDVHKLGTELSVDGEEYSVHSVHKITHESEVFKKNIERAHKIDHYSHNISIYINKHNKAFAIRVALDQDHDIVLIELM